MSHTWLLVFIFVIACHLDCCTLHMSAQSFHSVQMHLVWVIFPSQFRLQFDNFQKPYSVTLQLEAFSFCSWISLHCQHLVDSWEAGFPHVNDVCVVCVSAVSQSSGRHLPSSVQNVEYFRCCLPVTFSVQLQVDIHSSEALSIRQPPILTPAGLQSERYNY